MLPSLVQLLHDLPCPHRQLHMYMVWIGSLRRRAIHIAVCQVTCNCKISELQRTSPSELRRSGYKLHFQLRAGNKAILKFEKEMLTFLLFLLLFWWYNALEWRRDQVKDPLRGMRLIRMFRGRPSTSKSKKRKKRKKTYHYNPRKPNCKHSCDLCTRLQGI